MDRTEVQIYKPHAFMALQPPLFSIGSEAEKERVDVRGSGAMALPPFAHR